MKMKLIRFLYKFLIILVLIISVILSLNVYGIEFVSPYIFLKFEYVKTYPNIKFYEDVLPLQDGLAVIYRSKIGIVSKSAIKWVNIAYKNHKGFSDGNVAVAYVEEGKYLHIITNSGQKDILYPVPIKSVKVKNSRVLVHLADNDDNYLICYDKNQNIIFSAEFKEKVIDYDLTDNFAAALLKSTDTNDIAISYIDKRGVYMSKVLPPSFSNSKRFFIIGNHILIWNGRVIDVYDLDLKKKQRTFKFGTQPKPAVGNPDILVGKDEILVYNKLTKRFLLKNIEPFDWIYASSDKIALSKGNYVMLYSLNLNKIKLLRVSSFGFVKAVLSQDKLYYIFSDRIECYQERW